jgi:hypothetical protein
MKKFIIGILMLALIGLLMSNVYAGPRHTKKHIRVITQEQPVQYVPVNRYVGEAQIPTVRTVTWSWTNECPYHKTVVCAQPAPVMLCTAPREPHCIRCLRRIITCPFRLVEKILFD